MPAPIIPVLLVAAGAVVALIAGKKKQATPGATGTITLPNGTTATSTVAIPANVNSTGTPPPGTVVVPAGMTAAQVAQGYQNEVIEALNGLNVDPNTYQITSTPSDTAIQYASGLVARMRSSGFQAEAATLDKFVQDAIKKKNQVAPSAPVVVIPAIPAALQTEVNNAIQYCKDPAKLRSIADALAKLPGAASDPTIKSTIEMLNQMANQLQAQQIAATAMQQAGAILSSNVPPQVTNVATPTSVLSTAPAPTVTPATILNPPAPKSNVEIAADAMVSHLKRLQLSQGSVTKAKGKEDKNLVKKFQTLAKLTADGSAGPGTMVAAASFGQYELPLVMYWPKSSTTAKVYAYRDALETIASKLDGTNPTGAASLRASAAREKGQAGVINGPVKD